MLQAEDGCINFGYGRIASISLWKVVERFIVWAVAKIGSAAPFVLAIVASLYVTSL